MVALAGRRPEAVARRRVLIIDDDIELHGFLAMVLENGGYLVFSALSAAHGLDLLDVVEPDVVLLDATIPGTDALALTRVIRHVSCRPAVVILADRPPNAADWDLANEASVDDIVEKPFDVEDLLSRLSHVVTARRDIFLH